MRSLPKLSLNIGLIIFWIIIMIMTFMGHIEPRTYHVYFLGMFLILNNLRELTE